MRVIGQAADLALRLGLGTGIVHTQDPVMSISFNPSSLVSRCFKDKDESRYTTN